MKIMTLPKILQPFYCENLIRLGKDHDGGYLVNKKDIKKTKKLISFGIRDDWSFEEDFFNIKNCPIDAYDGSVSEEDKLLLSSFFTNDRNFISKNIGNNENEVNFLSTIEDQIFLKCDIEGSEYNILDDIIRNSKNFTGLVIEFHEINNYDKFNLLTNFISKINQKLVHVHVNNWTYVNNDGKYIPCVIELTFSSSSNIELIDFELPHKLDMPNCSTEDEFKIIF